MISILIIDKFLYRCLINPRIMSPESNCFLLTIVCLADSRPLRPWIHSASLIRKFRHHFQLKNGFCTMTDRRSNTVISRIATTDDNYIFALCRNIFAFFQLHLIFPETFRSWFQKIYCKVDSFRISSGYFYITRMGCTATKHHPVKRFQKFCRFLIFSNIAASFKTDAFFFHYCKFPVDELFFQFHIRDSIAEKSTRLIFPLKYCYQMSSFI